MKIVIFHQHNVVCHALSRRWIPEGLAISTRILQDGTPSQDTPWEITLLRMILLEDPIFALPHGYDL